MTEQPRYIGDGVFASFDGYHVVLKTGNPNNPDDTIHLDDKTMAALMVYASDKMAHIFPDPAA